MRGTYVHLRQGVLIAPQALANRLTRPLAEEAQMRLTVFTRPEDALRSLSGLHPRVVIADFESFGEAGMHGIATFVRTLDVPMILIMDKPSLLQREQLASMGVRTILHPGFSLEELKSRLDRAVTRKWRAGSDRLPAVSAT